MIFLQYRVRGNIIGVALPPATAHAAAEAAVRHGADFHVMQGTWDVSQRKHLPPDDHAAHLHVDPLLS